MTKGSTVYTLSSGVDVEFVTIMPGIVEAVRSHASTALFESGVAEKLAEMDLDSLTASGQSDAVSAIKMMAALGQDGARALSRQMSGDYADFLDFGVVMVSDLPSSARWVKLLKKRGVDMSEYDLEDDDDLRSAYIRYVAFGSLENSPDDWDLFFEHTGLAAMGFSRGEAPEAEATKEEEADG